MDFNPLETWFDFLNLIKTYDSSTLFGGAAFLMLLVIVLEIYKVGYVQPKERRSTLDSFYQCNKQEAPLCESADCIRCSKNEYILKNALEKLTYVNAEEMNNCATENLDECAVVSVQSDIKSSLKHLKKQKISAECDSIEKVNGSLISYPLVFKVSGIEEKAVWSLDDFPSLRILEKDYKKVCLEFTHLYLSPLSETKSVWKVNHTNRGRWELALLVDQGKKTRAAEMCPLTMGLIDQIPNFMKDNLFANVAFSVLHPGSEIAPHYGSTNCRIRCHLGLKVPKNTEKCSLRVGGEKLHWTEGKNIFFSDAFFHSVDHNGSESSGSRVVLMLDLWHPHIDNKHRDVINYVFGT